MRRNSRGVKPRFWLILMAVLVCVYAYLYSSQEKVLAGQRTALAALEKQQAQLDLQLAEASRKLEFAKSDAFIERVARTELQMIQEGEVLYVSGDIQASAQAGGN